MPGNTSAVGGAETCVNGVKPSTATSLLFVYSGGVWQAAQPDRPNTASPRAVRSFGRLGLAGGCSE